MDKESSIKKNSQSGGKTRLCTHYLSTLFSNKYILGKLKERKYIERQEKFWGNNTEL